MHSRTICICFSYILCLVSQVNAQQVIISVNSDTIYLESNVTVTCGVSVDEDTFLSLVPFFVINGTTIKLSCIGSSEYQPLTQRFSPLQHIPSSLATRISLEQVSMSDDGLSLSCAFYNLNNNNYSVSETISLNITNTTQPIAISSSSVTENFFITIKFYVIIGVCAWVVSMLILVTAVSLCVLGCYITRNRRLASIPNQVQPTDKYTHIKSEDPDADSSCSTPEKTPL